MSEHAQRIITSHKEAAKRATEYLVRTRNLKLKQAEALELVAQVLGVANWQTLDAMAKQGRAPRMDFAEVAPATATVVTEKRAIGEASMACRLATYYYERGYSEHPMFGREDWPGDVDVAGTEEAEYWGFALRRLMQARALFPWDRWHIQAIALCEAAGIDVDYDFNNERWVVASSELDEFLEDDGEPSELALWEKLAKEVTKRTKKLQGISDAHWHAIPLEGRCSATTAAFGVRSYRKPEAEPTTITRDFLLQHGFRAEFRPGERLPHLSLTLSVSFMPYATEHITSTGEAERGAMAVLDITPDNMLVFSIGEGYKEDPVPLESSEARGVFLDAGLPV